MTFTSFKEENFVCKAEPAFVSKCIEGWQQECRNTYMHNDALRQKLCETHLDRNYVKIRTLIPPAQILDQWRWDKARRDYDIGWVRTEFPKFSESGANYLSLPADLHKKMQNWYGRNSHRSVPESSQPAFGYNCNTGYDNDDWVVAFSPQTHEDKKAFAAVQEWIRNQLHEWTGQYVNELTAIYGAREYHRGSVCGMHTDAMETHAFSAIYQLDQQGMDKPWALDYVTHEGVEERVFMKPGDIVLYEGASMLHGRKDPLEGDQFTNVFFHFRSPNWAPAVKEKLSHYWDQRGSFERAAKAPLTSLGNAPKIEKHWTSEDQCPKLRSRMNPLMPEGHFMDLPLENTYDPKFAGKPPPEHNYNVHIVTEHVGEKPKPQVQVSAEPAKSVAEPPENLRTASSASSASSAPAAPAAPAAVAAGSADSALSEANPFSVVWVGILLAFFAVVSLCRFRTRKKTKLRMSV